MMHLIPQAECRGAELVSGDLHDGDAGLLRGGRPAHAHQQQAILHHGLLPPAAQQALQGPEGREKTEQGTHTPSKRASCIEAIILTFPRWTLNYTITSSRLGFAVCPMSNGNC